MSKTETITTRSAPPYLAEVNAENGQTEVSFQSPSS
jgi:hypothetical protein